MEKRFTKIDDATSGGEKTAGKTEILLDELRQKLKERKEAKQQRRVELRRKREILKAISGSETLKAISRGFEFDVVDQRTILRYKKFVEEFLNDYQDSHSIEVAAAWAKIEEVIETKFAALLSERSATELLRSWKLYIDYFKSTKESEREAFAKSIKFRPSTLQDAPLATGLIELIKAGLIKPEWISEETRLQALYALVMRGNKLREAANALTLEDQSIQRIFSMVTRDLADSSLQFHSALQTIINLYELTDFSPDKEEVERFYGYALGMAAIGHASTETIALMKQLSDRTGVPLKFPQDKLDNIFSNLIMDNKYEIIGMLEELTGIKFDWQKLDLSRALRDIKRFSALDLPASVDLAWHAELRDLRKIQAVSARAKYDPWTVHLQPLLNHALDQRLISAESRDDARLFVEFVKEFGAYKMPNLFSLYIDCKRNREVNQLSPVNLMQLNNVFGQRARRFKDTETVINELRKFRLELQNELLQDRIPVGLYTILGREIFSALIGSNTAAYTNGGNDVNQLALVWKAATSKSRELAKLPHGFQEKEIETSLVKTAEEPEIKNRQDEEKKILENQELMATFARLREIITLGKESANLENLWNETKKEARFNLSIKLAKTKERLQKTEEPKIKAGIEKNIANSEAAIAALDEISIPGELDEKALTELMERTAHLKLKELGRFLQILSSRHIRQVAEAETNKCFDSLTEGNEKPDKARLEALSQFLTQYLKEHYLHKDQRNHNVDHTPFSDELRKILEDLWQVRKDIRNHIIIQSSERLNNLEKEGTAVLKKTEKISFVPVRGILRAYSGTIGSSCYDSLRGELAAGKWPDITSIVMVTNRGNAQERIEGSVLFITATTFYMGKKVLLVRANNPSKNLLTKVDVESLIAKTLDYAIETAKGGGYDLVVTPIDYASGASSNRTEVADYYDRFRKKRSVRLAKTPETTFNTYPVYNPMSEHAARQIWP